jgi:hypothetical protein
MRLIRDLLALLLVAGGVYFWKHRPAPAPAPAIQGRRPNLSMPAAPGLRPADAPDSAGYVLPEENAVQKRHLAGKAPPPETQEALGDKPQILGAPAVDVVDPRGAAGIEEARSSWEDRLRQPWALAAIAALFVVLYALGTRSLRKGPGGGGFTHD